MYIRFNNGYLSYNDKFIIGNKFNIFPKYNNGKFELNLGFALAKIDEAMCLDIIGINVYFYIENHVLITDINNEKYCLYSIDEFITLRPYNKYIRKNIGKVETSFLDRDYSEGSFGYVYKNPRLMCPGETEPNFNEVSKVFKNLSTLGITNKRVIEKFTLQQSINKDMDEYLMLPLKFTTIDLPKNENGEYLNISSFQIIYKLGYNIIAGDFSPFINILYAISKLSKYGLAHTDIKLENIVLSDGKYKLIDLDNIMDVTKEHFNFYDYHLWPPLPILILSIEGNITFEKLVEKSKKPIYIVNNFELYISNIPDRYEDFKNRMRKERILDNENINIFLKYFKSEGELDMLNRIDIYSFGMLMLEIIYVFSINDDNIIDMIVPIIELCCFQEDKAPSFEKIIYLYTKTFI